MNRNFKHNINKEIEYLTINSFTETGIVNHCFTTRKGGESKGECSTLNLGFNRDDNKETVLNNYKKICEAIQIDYKSLVFSKQVHDINIKEVTSKDLGKGIIKDSDIVNIDGLITSQPKVPLVTFYADCVPLFFLEPNKKVVGLAHSGWRGTVKKIGAHMINKMVQDYNCNKDKIILAIGPSIGPCHFEVDYPVLEEFRHSFGYKVKELYKNGKEDGKYFINLWKSNELVFQECGIPQKNITTAAECTFCNKDLYFSHRRDKGKTGSLAAFIQIK